MGYDSTITQTEACQQHDARAYSGLSQPYPLVLVRRAVWHARNRGLGAMLRKLASFLRHKTGSRAVPRAARATGNDDALELRPGELVEVRTESEIQSTLDANGKNRGLPFLPELNRYCGQRFRVYKRVERIFLEESKQVRRVRNTVLLEGLTCSGAGLGCDKSCFYFWREAWLKRIDEPAEDQPPH